MKRRQQKNTSAVQSKLFAVWDQLKSGQIRCKEAHEKLAALFIDDETNPSAVETMEDEVDESDSESSTSDSSESENDSGEDEEEDSEY